jgi:hypothetical protein
MYSCTKGKTMKKDIKNMPSTAGAANLTTTDK